MNKLLMQVIDQELLNHNPILDSLFVIQLKINKSKIFIFLYISFSRLQRNIDVYFVIHKNSK